MRRLAPLLLFVLLALPALGCKDCEKLQAALVAAHATGDAALVQAAEKAWAASGCGAMVEWPPATCPDGLPPGPSGCPKTCADLACPAGCTEGNTGATCNPAPEHSPACPLPGQSADPSKWCGCWEISGRTGSVWRYVGDCPAEAPTDCRTQGCPPGKHCLVESVHGDRSGDDPSTWTEGTMASCVPDPPPPQTTFPVRFPKPGVRVYANNHKYGNGLDGTPRIGNPGDPELCELLHHVPVPNGDCHFDSDVWGGDSVLRGRYEMALLGGARDGGAAVVPLGLVWQYRSGPERGRCHDDRRSAAVSCDHFGNATDRDDPQTPAFEGQPAELGAQRDEFGPYAGFFAMPNCTPGRECSVRSCPPLAEDDDSVCGPWTNVDWR
jgi:hypothetical protein